MRELKVKQKSLPYTIYRINDDISYCGKFAKVCHFEVAMDIARYNAWNGEDIKNTVYAIYRDKKFIVEYFLLGEKHCARDEYCFKDGKIIGYIDKTQSKDGMPNSKFVSMECK